MAGTNQCQKCGSQISSTAERCPACGYEPSPSILGVLFYWVFALPFTLIFGVLLVGSVAGVAMGELTVSEALGGMFAAGLLGAVPFWYVRRYRRQKRKRPTG
jgi:uncharacterized membrane protein